VWGQDKIVYSADEILHFKNLSLNGFVGMSTLQMAREGVGQALAEGQHAASLFRNRATPGAILKYPGTLTPQQRQNMEQFTQQYEGALRSGKSLVLEAGFDLTPFGFNNADSQFLESREFSVREVARWFGVPAHMVGDVTRTSYNSSEMEMLNFLMHSLRPWLVNLEAELYSKLFPQRTTFFPRFDTTALARADTAIRFTAYSQALTAGWMTVADVREAESLPFIDGTDQLNRPANMVPAGETDTTDAASTTDSVAEDS
jgi:HK97 family phage portal protein